MGLASLGKIPGAELEKHQEVVAGIADVLMETFAMESAKLAAGKTRPRRGFL